jgi:pimeloyl-ACP methyl ester carboxylesterase
VKVSPICRLAISTVCATVLLAAIACAAGAAAPAKLHVGGETLRLCQETPIVGYCGRLEVPLDRGVYPKPLIGISFEWYPAADGKDSHPAGTVVPVEGGPGYASIESVNEEGYATMYGPLLQQWNMLVVDNRGTGTSTPINCPELQDFEGPTVSEAYEQAAADCANYLNERWHGPGGASIHAADLFTTAAAAADMAQILQALELGRIDLYGDSYGSYYAQVFAARYPQLLRSVILDSTYGGEAEETLPYTDHDELIGHIDAVCERWSACAESEHQRAWSTLGELAALLRAHPISGTVPGTHGRPTAVVMNVVGLVDLLNDAAGDKVIYGQVDAAARAALKGYDAPLLRLYEQRLVWDEDYFGEPVKDYSVGLYTDVTCTDYAQLYSLGAPLPQRRLEYEHAVAEAPAGAFSPFSTEEWMAQDQNTNSYAACLDWPTPTINEPPFEHPGPELAPGLPVLVLGGELDVWTPPAEVAEVLEFLGGDTRYVELANATHVVGEDDTPCGDSLVRTFVKRPAALHSLNTGCAAEPPIHAVGVFARALGEEPPATLTHGQAGEQELKLLAAAVQTAGDGITRLQNIHGAIDDGLNGGSVKEAGEGEVEYRGDQLIAGVAVSGIALQRPARKESQRNLVSATLTVSADGMDAQLSATWTSAGGPEDLAHISARIDGRAVSATVPAP